MNIQAVVHEDDIPVVGGDMRDTSLALISAWLHEDIEAHPLVLQRYAHADAAKRFAETGEFGETDFEITKRRAGEMVEAYDHCISQAIDLALVGAALVRCWASEIGVPPEELLASIAIGQAMG